MNLVVDIGNSCLKWALFESNKLIDQGVYDYKQRGFELFIKYRDWDGVNRLIVSAVVDLDQKTKAIFAGLDQDFLLLSHETNVPFNNNYSTPWSLGRDRIAAIVGGVTYQKSGSILVIDIGTCITYDFLDEALNYNGGGISPGIRLRFKALNEFTGKLPLIDSWEEENELIGDSTEKSISSGVMNGILGELNAVIERYQDKCDKLTIIITGGDSKYFERRLKSKIFVDSKLVELGLNEILNYHASQL